MRLPDFDADRSLYTGGGRYRARPTGRASGAEPSQELPRALAAPLIRKLAKVWRTFGGFRTEDNCDGGPGFRVAYQG